MPHCGAGVETRVHALLHCRWNDGVGERVMAVIKDYRPNIQPEQLLCLDFQLDEEQTLPVIWMMATVLQIIWSLRTNNSRVQLYEVRVQMEAKINLLRETRHSNAARILNQIVTRYF